jgi:AcrR family transcriptional regulator
MATAFQKVGTPDVEDGRARRAARSRAAIEDALYALVSDGILQPTMQEVATRAGVAMRSVFRHYSDMEGLFASVDARLRLEAMPLMHEPDLTQSLHDRLRALVRQRARIFDRIAPFKRSADVQRWRSPFIQESQQHFIGELRARLRRWLPELADLSADVQEAVELVLSFEAWDRLRTAQGLGRRRATAVMEHAATTLLGAPAPR